MGLADLYNGRRDDGSYDNIDEVIGVILCDDRDDPVPSFDEYQAEYDREVAQYPLLGRFVGSTPPRLRPPPPPSARVTEQLGDVRAEAPRRSSSWGRPGTRRPRSRAPKISSTRLAGSRLLTFDSTEHTAYTKNACIDRAVNAYLIRGTLPPEGTACKA